MSINFQELQDLLGAISQTDITEFILKNDDFELTVRKDKGIVAVPQVTTNVAPAIVETTAPLPVQTPVAITTESPETTPTTPAVDDKKWVDITSPMVGTFYRAPAPEEPPFVDVGERIGKGDTVCIIEAMKLMNDIDAEVAGEVMEILVQNGEPVEFGQVLMRVNPG